jgi:hypothetical protein
MFAIATPITSWFVFKIALCLFKSLTVSFLEKDLIIST